MTLRRGAILLEAIVSVAIFVAAAMTLIGILSQSNAIAARAKEEQYAADLCRSAMAELVLGTRTPESLTGPVRPPEPENGAFSDTPPAPTNWELAITTEPSPFPGLMKVTIDAVKISPRNERRVVATLHQLAPSAEARAIGGATP